MMIAKLRKSRGFTLVELMIVVAIIGILAALAIYGVRKYISNAKTAEARQGVGRIAKDASAAYSKEGMAAAVIDLTKTAGINNRLCASVATTEKVPASKDSIKAMKYQSKPSEWQTGTKDQGWRCLGFSMADPQYFMYGYTGPAAADAGKKDSTFKATAEGDLDGDGNLSEFSIGGKIQEDSAGGLVLTVAPNIEETSPDE